MWRHSQCKVVHLCSKRFYGVDLVMVLLFLFIPITTRPGSGPCSGDPPEVVVKCLELLGARFGTETNSKGFKVLPPYIRLIQVQPCPSWLLSMLIVRSLLLGSVYLMLSLATASMWWSCPHCNESLAATESLAAIRGAR